ncbi:hypothetical protein EA658_19655 [Pseudoxanthomonas winnipegensis]|jgi:uncharacterized protein YciI|uniref:YCII-related domain-containing protein n=1 Tax=Pseudoxanthomonas winnipegensis TaxID=2480810 RepID=A0ABY1W9N7_9GAMM|nr:YciI-like protein [Pseudoxanthomonas winnipegensis]TAA06966.1 hypothetical protein EA659_19050 [Pseudoxanthomonas winnipegensis]TAA16879.1 hypothetical protein EA658_19655 [Pseudoxanthomonas winnipegensis]TAH73493.1 hypothetical protein EA657_07435 [Pseudoxanthomonas winnipegensis]
MHFLLFYQTAADYLQRRPLHRAAHLAYARQAVARGELVLGGAVGDPPESALLLFQGEDDSAARRFAEGDPYVVEGIVASWTVRPWTTVVGADAAHRVPLG